MRCPAPWPAPHASHHSAGPSAQHLGLHSTTQHDTAARSVTVSRHQRQQSACSTTKTILATQDHALNKVQGPACHDAEEFETAVASSNQRELYNDDMWYAHLLSKASEACGCLHLSGCTMSDSLRNCLRISSGVAVKRRLRRSYGLSLKDHRILQDRPRTDTNNHIGWCQKSKLLPVLGTSAFEFACAAVQMWYNLYAVKIHAYFCTAVAPGSVR